MRKQFVQTVTNLMASNENVVLFLGDIGVHGFREVLSKYPSRAFNIGILEQATVSVAAGWALRGYYPIIHTIAPFVAERAYEQIKVDFGYQRLPGTIATIGGSYDYAGLGCTHHCPADVSLMENIPGMHITVPGDKQNLDAAIIGHHMHGELAYVRMSEYKNSKPFEDQPLYTDLPLVIAVGPTLDLVRKATELLNVNVAHVETIAPLNLGHIAHFPNKNREFIVVEPYYSSRIGEQIMEFMWPQPCSIRHFSVPRTFLEYYGRKEEIDTAIGFTANNLRKVVQSCLSQSKG